MKQIQVPKDLGIKIGTEDEIFWNDLRKKCKADIVNAKREIVINEYIIKLAIRKVEEKIDENRKI